MTPPLRERRFHGQPASPGLAVGTAFRLAAPDNGIKVAAGTAEQELTRFNVALEATRRQLEALSAASDELGGEILEFQLALLDDEDLMRPITEEITHTTGANEAWTQRMAAEIADYQAANDEYMAARAADLFDLKTRVSRNLNGGAKIAEAPSGAILLGEDFTPSEFLEANWTALRGLVLFNGSSTSHVSILARARGVPMIVECQPKPDVAGGEVLAIDGNTGELVVSPSPETLREFHRRRSEQQEIAAAADAIKLQPAATRDGKPVRVLINVNKLTELDDISPKFCDGVGLTRTEFLFAEGPPDEETQFQAYARIIKWAAGRPVTVRTLDAGGDKPVPGVTIDNETNPFLGMRGLRLSLKNPEVFRTQLRALARAAADGPLKIMVPMVSIPAEIDKARTVLDEVIAELQKSGTAHSRPQLGMMVEVPAAALTAGDFDVDFYSIGTNDLIQYTLAVSRDATGLSHLTRDTNPAVIELIRHTAAAGTARGVEVSICGDLAARPEAVATLVNCGISTLSVSPVAVPRIKLAISEAGGPA